MAVNICSMGLCSVEGRYFRRGDGVSMFLDTFVFDTIRCLNTASRCYCVLHFPLCRILMLMLRGVVV